jgi:serine/threonine protein kinase
MDTMRLCRQCRAPLPPENPGWVCADCEATPGRTPPHTVSSEPIQPPTPEEIAPLFPNLEILELMAQGGMGVIYKARQRHLDRLVALKIITPELSSDPAFADRFSREAQALARLNHSNIVGVFDFGQAGGYYFFVMEYVDGVTLRTLIDSKKLRGDEAQRIAVEICHALQFAHEEGIIHRDVKPSNILIDKKGRVKIADFGLAKLAVHDNRDRGQTTMVLGTPHYMAPEQIENPGSVDHRADIYALGVVFYEMLTGQLPLGRFEAPSKLAAVDGRLDEVVFRALEREPQRRYQQAREVRAAVETATGRFQAFPGDVPRRAPVSKKRLWGTRLSWVAGVALLAAIFYLGLKHYLPLQKSARIPSDAVAAFAAGPEGMGIGRKIVTALHLDKDQVQNVNRILRRSEREFTLLERRHTKKFEDSAQHVHISIDPFPDEMDDLTARMWADLAGTLSVSQLAEAKTLHFERFFPHTGKSPLAAEYWYDNGELHYTESQEPGATNNLTQRRPPTQRYPWYLPVTHQPSPQPSPRN